MRVNVTYISSNNSAFDFQLDTVLIKEANFHAWEFVPDVLGRRYGDRVLRFNKEAVTYETRLYVNGTPQEKHDILTAMHVAFEHDLRQNTMGRLIWGASYIDCFISASSTYPEEGTAWTANDIRIYAPYPFWIEPKTYEFYTSETAGEFSLVGSAIAGTAMVAPDGAEPPSNFLDYPFDYNYDYTSPGIGSHLIVNDSPGSAPFEMVIYGPAANPVFYIGSQQYIVYTNVQSGEYLTINSRQKTVYRTTITGEKINEFNNRGKVTSIFDPIPEGEQQITWPGTYGMTLTILKERSEPVWS